MRTSNRRSGSSSTSIPGRVAIPVIVTLLLSAFGSAIYAVPGRADSIPAALAADGGGDHRFETGKALSADGLEIAWERRACDPDRSLAPALVFVHGWCCDRTYWRHQTGGLEGRFTTVSLDLGGHGQSGTGREEWTIELFSSDVAAVVETLGLERVILVGHSMGGPVIAGAARLLGEKVAGLIGVDTYQSLGTKYTAAQVTAAVEPFRGDFRSTAGIVMRSMFRQDADEQLVERIVEDMSSATPEIAVGALESTLGLDPPTVYGGITVPVIAINSDRYPTDLEAARSLIPRFELRLVEGRGHFLMLEDPEGFNALLAEAAEEIAGKE